MTRKRFALLGVLLFIAALYVTFRLLGFPAGLFSTTFCGGLIVWIATTYRVPVDPHKLILPHLITVILFIVHVYEEFVSHIEIFMTRLTGLQVSQRDFLTIAAFIAPIVWLSGAVMMMRRWHFGFFFASVFYFGMMFGEPTHFIFPFIENGHFHYVAGMYTALLPSIAGWYTFTVAVREMRRRKREAAEAVS
jgi:hypothetical protein